MADHERILVTGAAGGVATLLRPRLGRPGRAVRLLDVRELAEPPGDGEEFVKGTINDLDAMTEACQGVTAVLHDQADQSRRVRPPAVSATDIAGRASVNPGGLGPHMRVTGHGMLAFTARGRRDGGPAGLLPI